MGLLEEQLAGEFVVLLVECAAGDEDADRVGIHVLTYSAARKSVPRSSCREAETSYPRLLGISEKTGPRNTPNQEVLRLVNVPLFTAAARRHARLMLRTICPLADHLDRCFRRAMRRTCDDTTCRAILGLLPSAAARLRSLPQFLEQVEYNGRRLAKLNVPPTDVNEALDHFDSLLAPLNRQPVSTRARTTAPGHAVRVKPAPSTGFEKPKLRRFSVSIGRKPKPKAWRICWGDSFVS